VWLLASLAWADPVAMRAPYGTAGATVGLHDASAAVPLGDGPWLAAELATNGASAGASAGSRWVLGPEDRVRRLQAGLAGGLLVPLVEPGIALTGTAWLHGGWVGERGAFLAGAAVPVAVGTGGSRMPLIFELLGGVGVGPVVIGGRLAAGPVVSPGVDTMVYLEPSLGVQLRP
jgi:hypothetical protein